MDRHVLHPPSADTVDELIRIPRAPIDTRGILVLMAGLNLFRRNY